MKEKSITKKILIQAGIAVAIIIPLFLGSLYLRSIISKTTSRIVQSRKEFAQKSASLSTLVNLQSQYKNFGRDYLQVLYNIVPQKDDLINISSQFQRIAAEHNLGFGFSFSGEQEASQSQLGYISYSIRVTGSNDEEIKKFINDLNNFQYLNKVESLSMSKENIGEGDNQRSEIEATLKGKVYFRQS